MGDAEVEALREVYAEFARSNFGVMLPLLDPSVEWRWTPQQMGLTGDEAYRGVAEVSRAMVGWLRSWDAVSNEAEGFVDLGDQVIVLEHLRLRPVGSSTEVESRQACIYTFRSGRIVGIENKPREALDL